MSLDRISSQEGPPIEAMGGLSSLSAMRVAGGPSLGVPAPFGGLLCSVPRWREGSRIRER
jgi:hypothetical protein